MERPARTTLAVSVAAFIRGVDSSTEIPARIERLLRRRNLIQRGKPRTGQHTSTEVNKESSVLVDTFYKGASLQDLCLTNGLTPAKHKRVLINDNRATDCTPRAVVL